MSLSSFRPQVEPLERRCTPATGNVSAQVQNGVLILTADLANTDDEIEIEASSNGIPGHFDVDGLNGTTINNGATFLAKGVRSIVCKLRGGDDQVAFEGKIGGNLIFNGGGGFNDLHLGFNCLIGGSVKMVDGTTTANFDRLFASFGTRIGRNVIANYGTGSSTTQMIDTFIGGRMAITGGSGPDRVDLNDMVIGGSVTAKLRGGSNEFYIDAIAGSAGGTIGSTIGGAVRLTTGGGEDTVFLGDESPLTIAGPVSLVTGNEGVGFGDAVHIDDTVFLSSVFLDLGAGNDVALFEFVDTGAPERPSSPPS